jgi:histone H3/H4
MDNTDNTDEFNEDNNDNTDNTDEDNNKTKIDICMSKPAIKRLLRRASVKRASDDVYECIRNYSNDFLDKFIKDITIILEYDDRKKIKTQDVELAMEIEGIFSAIGLNKNNETTSFKSIKSRHRSKKSHNDSLNDDDNNKSRKFKSGTVAMAEIKYYQKNSDSLAIPKSNFRRYIRAIAYKYKDDIKFSKNAVELIQYVTENNIVELCNKSNLCAIYTERQTLTGSDIVFAQKLIK